MNIRVFMTAMIHQKDLVKRSYNQNCKGLQMLDQEKTLQTKGSIRTWIRTRIMGNKWNLQEFGRGGFVCGT
jgi:hypothetical protein